MNDADITGFIEQTYTVLLADAFKRECDEYKAHELTQQVMERAWAKRPSFKGTTVGQWVQWCRTIMSRTWADNPTRRPLPLTTSLDAVAVQTADVISPLEYARERELLERIESLIPRLSPKLRGPIIDYVLYDKTYLEIGAAYGLCMGTVNSRVERGRKRLIELLETV